MVSTDEMTLALMGAAAASSPIAGPSNLDGAGFQNCVAESNASYGHQPNILLSGGDDSGIHISFDGGGTWRPANLGKSSQTWYFKVASIAFDDYSALNLGLPNRVLAYITNDDGTNLPPAESSGGTRTLHAGLFYGIIDLSTQTIKWYGPLITDANSNLYYARCDAAPHPRQSGDLLKSDPNHPVFYVGTEDGIQLVRLNSGAWETGSTTTISCIADPALYHSTSGYSGSIGSRCDNEISSITYSDSESTSTSTVLYATVLNSQSTAANRGVARIVITGWSTTLVYTVTRPATNFMNTYYCRRVKVVAETHPVIYVIANTTYIGGAGFVFKKCDITTGTVTDLTASLGSLPGWVMNTLAAVDIGGGITRLVLATAASTVAGGATKVCWADYNRSGVPTWTYWNNDATYWINQIGGDGKVWWLIDPSQEDPQLTYPPTFSNGSSGGASQLLISKYDNAVFYMSGRSGLYRRNANLFGGKWHPIVSGIAATVCNDFKFDKSSIPVFMGAEADVDFRTTLYPNGTRIGNPIIRRYAAPGSENKSVYWLNGILYAGQVDGSVTKLSPITTTTPEAHTSELGFKAVDGGSAVRAICVGQDAFFNVIVLAFVPGKGIYRKNGTGTPALITSANDGGALSAYNTTFSRLRAWWGSGQQVWFYNPSVGLMRSQNSGQLWINVFPITGLTGTRYTADVIEDPNDPSTVYVTVGGDIWRLDHADAPNDTVKADGTHNSGPGNMLATKINPTSATSQDGSPSVSLGPMAMGSFIQGSGSALFVNDQGNDGVIRHCSLWYTPNKGVTWEDIAPVNWKSQAALAYAMDYDGEALVIAACDGCGMAALVEGV